MPLEARHVQQPQLAGDGRARLEVGAHLLAQLAQAGRRRDERADRIAVGVLVGGDDDPVSRTECCDRSAELRVGCPPLDLVHASMIRSSRGAGAEGRSPSIAVGEGHLALDRGAPRRLGVGSSSMRALLRHLHHDAAAAIQASGVARVRPRAGHPRTAATSAREERAPGQVGGVRVRDVRQHRAEQLLHRVSRTRQTGAPPAAGARCGPRQAERHSWAAWRTVIWSFVSPPSRTS